MILPRAKKPLLLSAVDIGIVNPIAAIFERLEIYILAAHASVGKLDIKSCVVWFFKYGVDSTDAESNWYS